MPPKKKTEPPQAPAGPRTRNAPIDLTNWRQQSQNRAHERNRITYIAVDLAGLDTGGCGWMSGSDMHSPVATCTENRRMTGPLTGAVPYA